MCKQIRMKDGTVILAKVKPGAVLTEDDERAIAEFAQFCRDQTAKEQRKRNQSLLPGAPRRTHDTAS